MNPIVGTVTLPESKSGEQLLWFRRLGYVRVRDLVRGGILAYVFLTALVTLLTSDLLTLVFLGCFAVILFRIASVDQYVSPRRRVTVHTQEGLSIAEHVETGTVRHGETPADALSNLHYAIDPTRVSDEPE